MTEPFPITLDQNGQIPIRLELGALRISLSALENPEALAGDQGAFMLGLRVGGSDAAPVYDSAEHVLAFAAPASSFLLTLYNEPLLALEAVQSALRATSPAHYRLSVDELRLLAMSDVHLPHVPFSRAALAAFDPARHAPITDLHTHSSAQLTNQALMDLALAHQLSYPVELLEKLNIRLSDEERFAVQVGGGFGARFSPTEHELPRLVCETQNARCDVIALSALTPAHRARLTAQLQIPQDMTLSFSDFDRAYYRFVNPLVKNPALARDIILRIARDYQRNGVRYAELSTASMLNLDENGRARWFGEMITAVRDAERETGVVLRFLIGVPRSFGPAKLMAELEKITYAARHPLIVGVDLLGYESNRTSDFSAVLSHIAQWARAAEGGRLKPEDGWNFQRDFTIRIHAGETGKNSGNVAEAVTIAEHFGVRVRVAHAVNEALDSSLDARIATLSAQESPLVMMEFCPSSNLAYNNIQDLAALPFPRWLACCRSWFLGSDGAGAIQTTPTQLALAALAAGCRIADLEQMRASEEAFIADAMARHAQKTRAYAKFYSRDGREPDAAFLDGFATHAERINQIMLSAALDPIHPRLPKRFNGRRPLLIAGASGESFREIAPEVQQQIRAAMQQLVAELDPARVYFVVGRSKPDGVTAALDEAVMAHNERKPRNKFLVLALITEDIPDLPRSISWVVPQPGTRIQVPENIIAFMRGQLRPGMIPGVSIFIGGSNYTSDMILKCRQNEMLHYLLMENASGASQDFAKFTAPERRFHDGASLVAKLKALIA